jgi:hypothetical protein
VDTNEHASLPHDEPPGIIMETEPTNLSQTMGAQLGVIAGVPQVENTQHAVIAGAPEGTHTEIPGVPGPPGGDTETPGVPDGGTHNRIPGVPDGTAAETPEGDAATPDDTTDEAPEGDPTSTTYTDEDDAAMVDHNDSSSSQPGNYNTGVIEDTSNSGDEDEDEEEAEIPDSEVYHPEYITPSIQRV